MLRHETKIRKFARQLHEIKYEDLVNSYNCTMNLTFEFLGLPPYHANTKTLKQQDWGIKSRITNYDEFASNLKRKYRVYLEGMF